MIYVWPALAVALVGIVGGIAVAGLRGLRSWRDFKRFGRSLGDRAGEIETSASEIEVHLTKAGEASDRLSVALRDLRRSRAELDVLRAAIAEARTSVERAVPFLGPR